MTTIVDIRRQKVNIAGNDFTGFSGYEFGNVF